MCFRHSGCLYSLSWLFCLLSKPLLWPGTSRLSVCKSVSARMAAPRGKSNNGSLSFSCQSHFLIHREACLPPLIWGSRVCTETHRTLAAHKRADKTSAYTPLIDGRYSLGNWAPLADGVRVALWKHNLHPEFRQTVKLSLAACPDCLFGCRGPASMMKCQKVNGTQWKRSQFSEREIENLLILWCMCETWIRFSNLPATYVFSILREHYLCVLKSTFFTLPTEGIDCYRLGGFSQNLLCQVWF